MKKIASTEHSSLELCGDRLYATECREYPRKRENEVVIYDRTNNTWRKSHAFNLVETKMTNRLTLSVTKNIIATCNSSVRSTFNSYSFDGELINRNYMGDLKINSPFLCASDDKGNLLLGGAKTYFALVKGNDFQKVAIPPEIKYPGCVALDGDVIYIGSYQTLSMHSCKGSIGCALL